MKRLAAIVFVALLLFVARPASATQKPTSPANSTDQCQSPAVVASFLGFTDPQTAQFGDLLNQFQTTVYGLHYGKSRVMVRDGGDRSLLAGNLRRDRGLCAT